MTLVDRAIRPARRAAGYETRDVMTQMVRRDARWTTFCRAVEYVDYEAVQGDIVEFGVYRGHPGKGEARAFDEFLVEHPEWGAVQYQPYATFCNSFILHRR
jgi:hypothetical protein